MKYENWGHIMKNGIKIFLISFILSITIFFMANLGHLGHWSNLCNIGIFTETYVQAMETKKVLILNSYDSGFKWTRYINNGIESILKKENNLELYYEFMDMKNYNSKEYIKFLYESYKIKYGEVKFDIVICSDNDALDFIQKYGREVFKDSSVVFCGINNYGEYDFENDFENHKNITGVLEQIDINETIESIFKIQPNTKNVVVICDSSTTGKIDEEATRDSADKFKNKAKFYFYRDISEDKLKYKVSNLGKNTVILNVAQLRNKDGKLISYEKTAQVLKKFNLPIYTCWDFLMSYDFIGGKVISGYKQGETAAKLALKILGGEEVNNIPLVTKSPSQYVFNYNELHKYGIEVNDLPREYKIINEPFSFYKTYKKTIWHVIIVMVALIVFIIILMLNIRKRISSEKKLIENYDQLSAVNEELTATELELRAQYEELELREQEINAIQERYKLAVDGANDVIWEWDMIKDEIFFSDKWKSITGYDINMNESIDDILKKLVLEKDLDNVISKLQDYINGHTSYLDIECRINKLSGEERWIYARGKMLKDKNGKAIKMAGSITDITNTKNVEARNIFLSYYDKLTNLPNRSFCLEILRKKLKETELYNERAAVFYFDIDNFKNINDTLGHDYGDELLKEVGKRIQNILNNEEILCKIGGDEFLIIQWGVDDINETKKFGEKVIKALEEPFRMKEKEIFTTISMGISIFPDDGTDVNSILKNVDTAMNKVKVLGKNSYLFYNSNMYSEIIRKIEMEKGLRKAIENKELQLVFQPQVRLDNREVGGAEVLLRWVSGEFGYVSPDEFIPLAEETSLIIPIGKWVLKEACLISKQWIDEGYVPTVVGVNVSVIQLKDESFIQTIKDVLEFTQLPPQYLELEITESTLMKALDENLKILNEIRNMGVNISLDDFGTGYSSLSYLKNLPINKLKIDKSFMDNIEHDESSKHIVDGIIQLAHRIGFVVLAEGVETKAQWDILKSINCDEIQGYYFSKPQVPGTYRFLSKLDN